MPNSEIDLIGHFRTHHHAVAQLIAFGCTDSMIRRRTGISHRRLALYRADPTFNELVKYYSGERDEQFEEGRDPFRDLAYSNMMKGELEVAEHFERAHDAGELVPIGIANRISQERADRLGYSKHSVVHHEHDFAGALDRALSRSQSVMIEGKVVDAAPQLSPPPSPQEPVSETPLPDREPRPARLSIASVQRMEYLRRKLA